MGCACGQGGGGRDSPQAGVHPQVPQHQPHHGLRRLREVQGGGQPSPVRGDTGALCASPLWGCRGLLFLSCVRGGTRHSRPLVWIADPKAWAWQQRTRMGHQRAHAPTLRLSRAPPLNPVCSFFQEFVESTRIKYGAWQSSLEQVIPARDRTTPAVEYTLWPSAVHSHPR